MVSRRSFISCSMLARSASAAASSAAYAGEKRFGEESWRLSELASRSPARIEALEARLSRLRLAKTLERMCLSLWPASCKPLAASAALDDHNDRVFGERFARGVASEGRGDLMVRR